MKNMLKTFAVVSMVGAGSLMTDHTITAFLSTSLILIGGLWGGYMDGYRKGREDGVRYMLGE